jgi:hypothetical protein
MNANNMFDVLPSLGLENKHEVCLQYHFIRNISSEQDLGYNLYSYAGVM